MAGTTGAAVGRGAAGRCWAAAGAAAAAALVGADVFNPAGAAGGMPGADAGPAAPVGPPGGSVGSLMVGAAVGRGGKLMRTVSFFGCTLPVSFLGGCTAPVSVLSDCTGEPGAGVGAGLDGGMSAIMFVAQDMLVEKAVKFNSYPIF